MWQNLPNVLTVSRIAAVPLIMLLVAFRMPGCDLAASLVFAAAGITDYFDGKLARDWKVASDLGRMLDPIADKLVVGASLMMLVGMGRMGTSALFPATIIILREILISGLREYLASVRVGLPVSILAKWKTGIQMVAIGVLLCGNTGASVIGLRGIPATEAGEGMLWIAAILTIITGWDYLRAGIHHAVRS